MSEFHAVTFLGVRGILDIPPDLLIALDDRAYRFAVQPFHHLIRMAHILSVSGFFGAICILDLRLICIRADAPLKGLADMVLPWVYVNFGIAVVTGLMLFFYDPVHVASHAYFSLKMILIALGLANAAAFNYRDFGAALGASGPMPTRARIFGALSLTFWFGVMICANLNVEAAPKVFLR